MDPNCSTIHCAKISRRNCKVKTCRDDTGGPVTENDLGVAGLARLSLIGGVLFSGSLQQSVRESLPAGASLLLPLHPWPSPLLQNPMPRQGANDRSGSFHFPVDILLSVLKSILPRNHRILGDAFIRKWEQKRCVVGQVADPSCQLQLACRLQAGPQQGSPVLPDDKIC